MKGPDESETKYISRRILEAEKEEQLEAIIAEMESEAISSKSIANRKSELKDRLFKGKSLAKDSDLVAPVWAKAFDHRDNQKSPTPGLEPL